VLSLATGGDDVLMRKYVTMYLDSAGSQIAEIVEGFRKREMEQVHGRVHQLKAHLKMMGMSLTAEIAEEIEARLTNGDPGNVLPDLIQQLARDCQHSLEELQRYVDTA
jgi:HPt (histidine-containing phosphotransfer) domain-containing protein